MVATTSPIITSTQMAIGERPLLHCANRPGRRFAQYAGISAGIGVCVVLLMSLNQPGLLSWMEVLGGMVMGVAIGSGAILGELLLLTQLLNLGLRPTMLVRCLCYFAGGCAGYWVGLLLSHGVLGLERWSDGQQLQSMLLYGAISVAVGLTFHTVESLRTSLAEKVAELRDREYAQRELETARLIQKRLMPPELTSGSGFQLAARNRAASVVAGDFYDYFHLPDGTMGFAIADVAGKGIGASLQMATVKAVLPLVAANRVATDNPVAGTLDDLNERLCKELGPREFVALLYGRFDPQARTVELANAGLPDPYWLAEDDQCQAPVQTMEVPGERLPLGVRRGTRYQSLRCSAEGAGLLVLLTDGLVERDAGGEPLGYQRFETILQQLGASSDASGWLDRLQDRLNAESGGVPEDDDCTTMVIHCENAAAGSTTATSSTDTSAATSESTVSAAQLAEVATG